MLVARGQVDGAFTYARDRAGSTTCLETIARLAEETLLQAGRRAEAFDRYALLAKQAGSNQSTVRALAGGYPELAPDKLLAHLIASTPGESGKWFATAKTLTRAARDHLTEQPAFAMQAALAALHGDADGPWLRTHRTRCRTSAQACRGSGPQCAAARRGASHHPAGSGFGAPHVGLDASGTGDAPGRPQPAARVSPPAAAVR